MAPVLAALLALVLASSTAAIQLGNVGTMKVSDVSAQKEEDEEVTLGASERTDEAGFQRVAALKSNADMKVFARRVLALEARYVRDEAGLSGLVPYYSGVQGTRSLESMKKELRAAPWVAAGPGRTAPLTEEGYQQVAALRSAPQMKAFMRRALESAGLKVANEAALKGFAPYFSGEVAAQSYAALLEQLKSATWVVPVLQWERVSGSTAPLTEEGYQSVAKLGSNAEMKAFALRLIGEEAREVTDEVKFGAAMAYYSGVKAVQSLQALKAEIRGPARGAWIAEAIGRTAPLTEAGYQEVAARKSDVQMKAFFRRLLVAEGKRVISEGGLNGAVPFFSGRLGVESLGKVKAKLAAVDWVGPLL